MSVHLKRTEAPGAGIRRLCRRHAGRALASLRQGYGPDAVHDARKEIKKLRALFRLAGGSLGRGRYQSLAEAMRLSAKPLGSVRDARVTLKALELLGKNGSRHFPIAYALLTRHAQQEEQRFKTNASAAVAQYILQTLRERDPLDDLKIEAADWNTLAPCLKNSYRRSRAAAELARLAPTPLHLHEWRKQTKNFWYQLDFLCPKWPPRTRTLIASLEELGEQLGDDHDLVLLRQFVDEHCEKAGEAAEIKRAVDRRRKELAVKIETLGERLFAPKPKIMCAQIKKDWKKWRDKK